MRPRLPRGCAAACSFPTAMMAMLLLTSLNVASAGKIDGKTRRAAAFQTVSQLTEWGMVARVPLKDDGEYRIDVNGEPVGNQGKMYGLNMFNGDMAFRPGDVARGFTIQFKKDELRLLLYCCRNREADNSSVMAFLHIELGREPTLEDIDPVRLKRTLSTFFEIGGASDEASVANVLGTLEDSAASPSPAAPARETDRATVLDLWVEPQPGSARRGETVELVLSYNVAVPAGGSVPVTEERVLSFMDAPLPGYPSRSEKPRTTGPVRTTLSQRIPAGAAIGTYTLQGEVCIGGDCISRRTTLRVTP